MTAAQKEVQIAKALDLERMQDNMVVLREDSHIYKSRLDSSYFEQIKSDILFSKVSSMDDDLINLKSRMDEIEQIQDFWRDAAYMPSHAHVESRRKTATKRMLSMDHKTSLQECSQIIDRIVEILAEWSETQEMRNQIQYAALVVAKIENIKKKDFIRQNEIKKKICTLLRAALRLNVTDHVFTKEQISSLEKGFLLLLSDNVRKADMLQLNREFWNVHLETMPAWE